MNEKIRERLRDAVRMLTSVASVVEAVCDNEQDAMDNIPENLQATERFELMEDAVDSLNDALEKIEDAKGHIQSALG